MRGVALMYVAIGVLLIGLSIPLILGRVSPNRWYGFRVQATLEDPALWYAVNARAGISLLIVGGIVIGAALLLSRVSALTTAHFGLMLAAILVAALLASSALTWLYLRALSPP